MCHLPLLQSMGRPASKAKSRSGIEHVSRLLKDNLTPIQGPKYFDCKKLFDVVPIVKAHPVSSFGCLILVLVDI